MVIKNNIDQNVTKPIESQTGKLKCNNSLTTKINNYIIFINNHYPAGILKMNEHHIRF
jgi:hypothetical protein